MPNKDPVSRAEYYRQYRAEHREENLERHRQYRVANREAIRERQRQYLATPEGRKCNTINTWKQIGLVCDDYDALYDDYLACEQCQDCGKAFTGAKGDGSGAYRQMDHNHETGAFRAFVCSSCNTRRGYQDAAASAASPATACLPPCAAAD